MTDNERRGIKVLGIYTRGDFDIRFLKDNSDKIRHVLAVIKGDKKVTNYSIHALRECLYRIYSRDNEGETVNEVRFIEWCKRQ